MIELFHEPNFNFIGKRRRRSTRERST